MYLPQEPARGDAARRTGRRDPRAGAVPLPLPVEVRLPVMAVPLLRSRRPPQVPPDSGRLLLPHSTPSPLPVRPPIRQRVGERPTNGEPFPVVHAPRLLSRKLPRLLQWTSAVQTRRHPIPGKEYSKQTAFIFYIMIQFYILRYYF